MQNNNPNVANSFPLPVAKSQADIENCKTLSLSLLASRKLSCLAYKPFTFLVTLLTQAATMDGAWISSTLWNDQRLMQNIPSSGFISVGSVISSPIVGTLSLSSEYQDKFSILGICRLSTNRDRAIDTLPFPYMIPLPPGRLHS